MPPYTTVPYAQQPINQRYDPRNLAPPISTGPYAGYPDGPQRQAIPAGGGGRTPLPGARSTMNAPVGPGLGAYNPAPNYAAGGNFQRGTAGRGIGTGSAFTEGGLLDYVAQDPSLYLMPMFDQRFGSGWSSGAGGLGGNLYGLMADQMRNANALYMLNNPGTAGGAAQFEGFLSNFANSRMTPGQFTDVGGLLGALNNPTGTLASYLFAGGDARSQVQNYLDLARGLAAQGMHPMVAEAFINDVAMRGKEYLAATAQGRPISGGMSQFASGRSGMY